MLRNIIFERFFRKLIKRLACAVFHCLLGFEVKAGHCDLAGSRTSRNKNTVLILQRGRGGFLLGLKLNKMSADSNYSQKTVFL